MAGFLILLGLLALTIMSASIEGGADAIGNQIRDDLSRAGDFHERKRLGAEPEDCTGGFEEERSEKSHHIRNRCN